MEVYPRMPREGCLEKVVEGPWRESSTEGLGQWVTTPGEVTLSDLLYIRHLHYDS